MILVIGSDGFIGKHIRLYAKINNLQNIKFINRKNFNQKSSKKLFKIAKTIIHLAGINKSSQGNIYKYNVSITKKILDYCENNINLKKFFFSSSKKIDENTTYGKSKKICENIIKKKFNKTKIKFYNLRIPNVFGEFCKPNYNSVIATLSNNLFKKKKTIIKYDKNMRIIYIGNLVKEIFKSIENGGKPNLNKYTNSIKLFKIKNILENFYIEFNQNIIPKFRNNIDIQLYNTLKSYAFPKKINIPIKKLDDHRGVLLPIIKSKTKCNFFTSITKKHKVRGNHYHTKKIEKFIVIQGKGLIKFRNILEKKVYSLTVDGNKPICVDIPNYYTHNIKNITNNNLLTLFYSNEFYNSNFSDTYYEKV